MSRWKRTEIRFWRIAYPAKPWFKRYYDGEVTMYYFGTLVVSWEVWYE